MALFGSQTKKKPVAKTEKSAAKPSSDTLLANTQLENMLSAPWLSEKALIGTEHGSYVFQVPLRATKSDIKAAIERLYKVVPVKITVASIPGKRKALRNKRGFGVRADRRKAYVHLKKGETITFA